GRGLRAGGQQGLARVHGLARRWPEARQAFAAAVEVQEALGRDYPEDLTIAVNLGLYQVGLAEALGEAPRAAVPWYDRAVGTLEGALEKKPGKTSLRALLLEALLGRARALTALGRHRGALGSWDRAVALTAGP